MKQGSKAQCIKDLVAGLLLLLMHTGIFAQDEDTTTEYPVIDTTATVSTYTENEDEQTVKPSTDSQQEPPVFRVVPDSVVNSLKQQRAFAYANDPDYWKKEERSNSWIGWLVSKGWFRYMLLTLLIAVLLFALIKIAVSNRLFIFNGGRKSSDAEEDELLHKENLEALVQEAEAQNNFRLAVRYRYMKVLQDMDDRQIISLNAQSTNWDYVNSLSKHPLKNQFLLLTRAYEYVWYGEFEIDGEKYGYLKTEFQQFENSLNR